MIKLNIKLKESIYLLSFFVLKNNLIAYILYMEEHTNDNFKIYNGIFSISN